MSDPVTTLEEHILALGGPEARNLEIVVTQLGVAGRIIARELARAALVGQLGSTGETNVQGETQKKLDILANNTIIRACE